MDIIRRLRRKFDALAVQQLRDELTRLQQELDDANKRAMHAEEWAEHWRDDALRAIEMAELDAGLTKSGHLVGVPSRVQRHK